MHNISNTLSSTFLENSSLRRITLLQPPPPRTLFRRGERPTFVILSELSKFQNTHETTKKTRHVMYQEDFHGTKGTRRPDNTSVQNTYLGWARSWCRLCSHILQNFKNSRLTIARNSLPIYHCNISCPCPQFQQITINFGLMLSNIRSKERIIDVCCSLKEVQEKSRCSRNKMAGHVDKP